MLRIFALCRRFVYNMRVRLNRGPLILGRLRLEETDSTMQNIIKLVQIITFLIEMETLRRIQHKDEHDNTCESQERPRKGVDGSVMNKEMILHLMSVGKIMRSSVARRSSIKNLNLFVIDEVIRVGGRLKLSCLLFESKHPLILPSNHIIADLIVMHYYSQSEHSGITVNLNRPRK